MTATDILRHMLDERGVEYEDDEDVTRFFGPDGFEVVVQEDIDGKLDCLTPLYLTPEQAIAAALGDAGATGERQADAGTCHNNGYVYFSERYFVCSSCGCEFDYSDFACEFAEGRSLGSPHFCPNCGARVVEPTTNDVDAEATNG